jgi:hypothetical protein
MVVPPNGTAWNLESSPPLGDKSQTVIASWEDKGMLE